MEERIGDIIKKMSNKDIFYKKIHIITIIKDNWLEITNNKLYKKSNIYDYDSKNKTIIINCASPIIMQEFIIRKNIIINNINNFFETPIVENMKLIRECD